VNGKIPINGFKEDKVRIRVEFRSEESIG